VNKTLNRYTVEMMIRTLPILFLLASSSPSLGMHIVIDPGHGGADHGTTRKDFKESEAALEIAKRLGAKLQRNGHRVTLTRNDDRQLSLLERVRITDKSLGEILLSIHVNSSPDAKPKGAEFYFQNQLAADDDSMYLASRENTEPAIAQEDSSPGFLKDVPPNVKAIIEDLVNMDRIARSSELCKELKTHWRGNKKHTASSIQQAPFVVISLTHIPAALVEVGFISNSEDFASLTNSDYLDLVAQSLFEGLTSYHRTHAIPAASKILSQK
jgi:N-acetylmuramoyl-L-alanine amidase